MLNEAQVVEIAEKINARVNIPLLSESTEERILETIINTIDDELDEAAVDLPPILKDIWDKLEGGLTPEKAFNIIITILTKELTPRLTKIANEKINIPLLSEETEARLIIEPAIELILASVRAQTS